MMILNESCTFMAYNWILIPGFSNWNSEKFCSNWSIFNYFFADCKLQLLALIYFQTLNQMLIFLQTFAQLGPVVPPEPPNRCLIQDHGSRISSHRLCPQRHGLQHRPHHLRSRFGHRHFGCQLRVWLRHGGLGCRGGLCGFHLRDYPVEDSV